MDPGLAEIAGSGASFPWLSLIVLLPAATALILPFVPAKDGEPSPAPRNITLAVLLADLLLMIWVIVTHFNPSLDGLQLVERVSWLPAIGLEWSLGVDGLSAPLVVLSACVTRMRACKPVDSSVKRPNLRSRILYARPTFLLTVTARL